MMMGVWPPCRRTPQRSNPFVSGNMMSSTTRSGANVRASLNAASPSAAHFTSKPSKVRLSPRTRDSDASSSTMRIRFFILPRYRNNHAHRRAGASGAANRQSPAVIGHDTLHNSQPQPAAVGDEMASTKKLPRDMINLVRGDATPLVRDIEDNVSVVPMRRDVEIAS